MLMWIEYILYTDQRGGMLPVMTLMYQYPELQDLGKSFPPLNSPSSLSLINHRGGSSQINTMTSQITQCITCTCILCPSEERPIADENTFISVISLIKLSYITHCSVWPTQTAVPSCGDIVSVGRSTPDLSGLTKVHHLDQLWAIAHDVLWL